MPLVLTLHGIRDPGNRQRESRTLDEGSLTIGRAPGNGWVLQDPAQHLSKTHCIVSASATGFVITDCSSNGVFLNGGRDRMTRDSKAPLNDGDEFALGEYVVKVRFIAAPARAIPIPHAAPAPPPATPDDDPFGLDDFLAPRPVPAAAPPAAPPPQAAAPRFDPFADPARDRRDDPLGDDSLLSPPAAPAHRPFGDPAPRAAVAPTRDPFDISGQHGTGRPDPLFTPTPTHPPAISSASPQSGAAPQRDAFGSDDDLFRGVTPAVEWQGPSQPDNLDAISHAFAPPKVITPPNMDDWDDLLGDTPPGSPFATPAHVQPQVHTPAPLPVPVAAPPSPPPPAAAVPPTPPAPIPVDPFPADPFPADPFPADPFLADPILGAQPPHSPPPPSPPASVATPAPASSPGPSVPPQTSADASRLLAAFLDGAGVPGLDVSKQDPDAYFHQVGELFATMVESLRDVLMSRAVVKGEFGVEQTMLRPRDNNALKFSVTPADAVSALLQPGRPGYMAPLRATREAFDDVRIHQLAVMAGVQAALMNLLHTFDPAALESRLAKGGMVESLIPGSRRSKLWEAFCATYKDIARDADSDFQAVFGREFARAYTEQAKAK